MKSINLSVFIIQFVTLCSCVSYAADPFNADNEWKCAARKGNSIELDELFNKVPLALMRLKPRLWDIAINHYQPRTLEWLKINAPLNSSRDVPKISPWLVAAAMGDIRELDQLKVEGNRGIGAPTSKELGIWFVAALHDKILVLDWLFKNKVPGVDATSRGWDIWRFTLENERTNVLNWLIQKKIAGFRNVFQRAQESNKLSIINTLKEAYAKATCLETDWEWALKEILKSPYEKLVEILASEKDLELKDIDMITKTYNPWLHAALKDINDMLDPDVTCPGLIELIAKNIRFQDSLKPEEYLDPEDYLNALFQMFREPAKAKNQSDYEQLFLGVALIRAQDLQDEDRPSLRMSAAQDHALEVLLVSLLYPIQKA